MTIFTWSIKIFWLYPPSLFVYHLIISYQVTCTEIISNYPERSFFRPNNVDVRITNIKIRSLEEEGGIWPHNSFFSIFLDLQLPTLKTDKNWKILIWISKSVWGIQAVLCHLGACSRIEKRKQVIIRDFLIYFDTSTSCYKEWPLFGYSYVLYRDYCVRSRRVMWSNVTISIFAIQDDTLLLIFNNGHILHVFTPKTIEKMSKCWTQT